MEFNYPDINLLESDTMLEVIDLKQYFPIKAGLMQRVVGHVKAVDGVSFSIPPWVRS